MPYSKPRILAIDDTPVNLLTLGAALKKDFDLQLATSGMMGLELALKEPPDLVLLDIMMPDMDGFETCQRFKADPILKAIPIVFITADNALNSEVKGLALGAMDYITKPIQVETARQRIRNLLEREQYRKTLELKLAELQLAQNRLQLAASVFASAREAIMITSLEGDIIEVNGAFERMTGYSRSEVLGKNPRILNSGRQSEVFYEAFWLELRSKGHWYGELWNQRKNGEFYVEMLNISTVFDEQGQPQNYVSLASDITAFKEHEAELDRVAHYDALTGLPNRVLLAKRLRLSMSQAQRHCKKLAVLFLDLDGFKAVNDKLGHQVGDQFLMTTSNRMKLILREGDTLARLGGDEFIVVLTDLEDSGACIPMLRRLLDAAAQPMEINETTVQVSASLGVTFYPQTQEIDADQLIRQADQSMYQAKLAGKNRYHLFDAAQDSTLRSHNESLERIRQGLNSNEFVLFYQPQVNLRTGELIGAEALIRWQHPVHGLQAPSLFLPVIEDNQLAIDLGEWVIDRALSQMDQWQTQGFTLPVSVNVGARQLQQITFVESLRAILAKHPMVMPNMLKLEVLETSALENITGVNQTIEQCRKMGVAFALDDFGTGYSSLTYLKRLPVAQLKIDQSFVRDMLVDAEDLAILQGVIGLAKAFQRQVIAEGVETNKHSARLLELGCELAQGFGIARPMPPEAIPAWAAAWKPELAWSARIEV